MLDLYRLPTSGIPEGFVYCWLDLENRGWKEVEFLPNGWERVPYSRHASIFKKTPGHDFIEYDGLTLCEQPALLEKQKQGLDWDAATAAAEEFSHSFTEQVIELRLQAVNDLTFPEPDPPAEEPPAPTRKTKKK